MPSPAPLGAEGPDHRLRHVDARRRAGRRRSRARPPTAGGPGSRHAATSSRMHRRSTPASGTPTPSSSSRPARSPRRPIPGRASAARPASDAGGPHAAPSGAVASTPGSPASRAVSSPQGRFPDAALVDGRVLDGVTAHGKHLFAAFGDHIVHVHLGLFGKVAEGDGDPPPPLGAVRMRWVAPTGWSDLRGPTACEVLSPSEVEAIHQRLGPDPLAAAPQRDPGLRPHRPQQGADRRAADGPGGRRRASATSTAPRSSTATGSIRTCRVGCSTSPAGRRCGPTSSRSCGAGSAPAGSSRPSRRPRASPWSGRPGGRPLRVPPRRPPLPHLRDPRPDAGARRAQALLVPVLPSRVAVCVTAQVAEDLCGDTNVIRPAAGPLRRSGPSARRPSCTGRRGGAGRSSGGAGRAGRGRRRCPRRPPRACRARIVLFSIDCSSVGISPAGAGLPSAPM